LLSKEEHQAIFDKGTEERSGSFPWYYSVFDLRISHSDDNTDCDELVKEKTSSMSMEF